MEAHAYSELHSSSTTSHIVIERFHKLYHKQYYKQQQHRQLTEYQHHAQFRTGGFGEVV
jgi:hypothetical protein